MKIAVQGRIQTGSYTNKDGAKVYTVEVVVDEQEFAEKRSEGPDGGGDKQPASTSDGFMNIPEGIEENLPF
jgi:single-strand DNA-binding protein